MRSRLYSNSPGHPQPRRWEVRTLKKTDPWEVVRTQKRKCKKCLRTMPLIKFSMTRQGDRLTKCWPCKSKERPPRTEFQKRRQRIFKKRWALKNKLKTRAHQIINGLIFYGKIKRPNKCSMCHKSRRKIQAHHDDYSKPKKVRWLCIFCHNLVHLNLRLKKGQPK